MRFLRHSWTVAGVLFFGTVAVAAFLVSIVFRLLSAILGALVIMSAAADRSATRNQRYQAFRRARDLGSGFRL